MLIVKLSAIGDLVHALPTVAALKAAYPHLEITWICEPMSAPMVTGNPDLSEVIVLPAEWRINRISAASLRQFRALRRDLRARRFDIALDLQGLSKSALIAWASGAPRRFGYDYMREVSPYLVTRIPRRPESLHIVDQLLDVARFLGAPVENVRFPLHIPPEEDARAAKLLCEAGIGIEAAYIALNPTSGGGGFKGWGAENYAGLVDRIREEQGLPTVLVGAKGDSDAAAEIRRLAKNPPVSLVGATNLKQLAAILRRTRLHVCGDTGSAHIAAAMGTRVVSIFGRTDPVRLAPYGQERFVVVHREACAAVCRRYHETMPINRTQKCFAPPPACMAAVNLPEVARMVGRALAEIQEPRDATTA